ncbi:MAG TPA: hypothetical protein VFC51_05730 [Chloroflexota bacterium]|nr:hypothetical protein [Chloroflexota bacterium]
MAGGVVVRRLSAVAAALVVAGAVAIPDASAQRTQGASAHVGNGQVTTYAELQPDGTPTAIGIVFAANVLDGLPSAHTDQHHCYDRDGDGVVTRPDECESTHEFVIPLPDSVATRSDIPLKWVLFNWNPVGHIPPGVYDVPHFDVHFYLAPIADTFAINVGACGDEFVDCTSFDTARMPLPRNFMPPDYANVDAVAPAMGNHLIDLTGSEFNGQPFTNTLIYGTYGGHLTFIEDMVTLAYLRGQPDGCTAIKTPPAVEVAGYYPTQYCVRYHGDSSQYTVSLESFVHREASPAQFVAPDTGAAAAD